MVCARRGGAAIGVGFALVLVLASPAAAHATLLQSDPAPGAVLQQSPSAITLRFDSPVSATLGAVRVYDSQSNRVDAGGTSASGSVVRLRVPKLRDGSYVVTWRVTSADTHPVDGAFTFQVGTTGNASSPAARNLAQRLLGKQGGDPLVGAAYGATRWLVFGGLALLLGAVAFVGLVWPQGRRSTWTRRWAWAGWLALLVGTFAGILLYGPYAAGLGLGDTTQSSLLANTLGSRYGEIALARLLLLLLAIPVVRAYINPHRSLSPRIARRWGVAAIVLAALLAATPGLAGHAVTGRWVNAAIVADTFHVLAMGVWLGGLGLVVTVLLSRGNAARLRGPLLRWSTVAAGCLTVIVATGAFQAWRQVGNLGALRSTDYGRMLIVKVVLFTAMVALASFGRDVVVRIFPRSRRGPIRPTPVVAGGADDLSGAQDVDIDTERAELRRLRRSVGAEVVAGVAVLIVTALLVNAPPPRSAAATGATPDLLEVTLKSSRVWVDVILTPGRRGTNDIHVSTLRSNGRPVNVQELRVTLDLQARRISPITLPLNRLDSGHYLTSSFNIPIAGTWRVTARPLFSAFDEETIVGNLDLKGS